MNIPDNENEFEILCLKLLRVRWKRPQMQQYGKRGERQHGVDLLDTSGATPFLAAQCKHHESHKFLPPSEIETEVAKARTFLPPLDHYAILTTARVSKQAQDKIVEINQRHESLGLFTVELLHWRDIELLLNDFPEVKDDIYGGLSGSQAARIEQTLTEIQLATKTPIIEKGSPATPNLGDEAVIDEANGNLERHEYQLAKLLLQRLRRQRWDVLDSRLRFRLLSNLGAIALSEGQPDEAAQCFFEAYIFQPDNEKARTNQALAYFLTGDPQRAHEIAASLREEFPQSPSVLSVWIQSAPPDKTHTELALVIPEQLLADSGVAVSLAVRALQRIDFAYAETVLRSVRTGKKNWSTVPGLVGKAILGADLYDNLTTRSPSHPDRRARLGEAEHYFTQAVEYAKAEKQTLTAAGALLDRSHVRMLLGRHQDAAADVEEAHHLSPEDPSVLSALAELKRMRGDLDGALLLLRGANQLSSRIDLRYQLAAILRARGRAADNREAAEILTQLAREPQLPPTGRDHTCVMAVDCLCRDHRFEEAQRFLDSIPNNSLAPLSRHVIQARLFFSRDDIANANAETTSALAATSENTTRDELEYLAGLLNDLGRHNEALPLWQKLIHPGEPGPDPRRLLNTAYRLQRYKVVLDTCEQLRQAGVFTPDLLQYEVAIFEQFDPQEAIRLLQEHQKSNPDDSITQLHISLIAFRIGQPHLVVSEPSRMPPVANAGPFWGGVAVQLMKSGGHLEAALDYAYELLRLHFLDPLAHRAYQFVLLPFGQQPDLLEHDAVQVDSAVTVLEDGTTEERTFVLEVSPQDGPTFPDTRAPHSALAKELMGKRVADPFVLAPGSLAPRTAKILRILNKYVYRYHESMSNWQIRFPDEPGLESIQVVKKPDEPPDLSVLLASVDRLQETTERLKQAYREQPMPIHLFADFRDKNAFQGMCMMAQEDDFVIDCCLGTPEEQAQALQKIRICSEIVMELTAIATIALLNLESKLSTVGIPLTVSQATLNELTEMATREEMETAEGGHFSKVDGHYVYQERNRADHEQHVLRLKQLLSTIKASCRIVPAREVISLEPSRREVLDKAFGRYGTEAILLSAVPGRLLWTDDYRLARFAAGEHGTQRIWTQVLLLHLLETGKISPEEYFRANAKLIGFEYAFTSLNPNILLSAARIADWKVGHWPLKQAIAHFLSPFVDTAPLLRVAILSAIQLYQEPVSQETRDLLFSRILDSLAQKSGATDALKSLEPTFLGFFGLNVVGGQQATECLRRWFRGRHFGI